MRRILLVVVGLLISLVLSSRASSAVVASDTADNAAYNDGWQSGDNGGTGFNAWSLSAPSGNSAFLFTSTANGNGDGNSDGDIDGTINRSWGLFGDSTSAAAEAVRSFAFGSLALGHVLHVDMDNGFIDNNGNGNAVGLSLRNSSGQNVFEFLFRGGQSFYQVNDAGGFGNSTIGFSDEGLELDFRLTSASTYSLAIKGLNPSANNTVTGTLMNPLGGQSISQLRLFNYDAGGSGGNGERNAYFNNIVITSVPEAPAYLFGTLVCGVLGGVYYCRKLARRNAAGVPVPTTA